LQTKTRNGRPIRRKGVLILPSLTTSRGKGEKGITEKGVKCEISKAEVDLRARGTADSSGGGGKKSGRREQKGEWA